MLDKNYYSKLLLFGEYSIIKDSMGLVIPYPTFKGSLSFDNKFYDRNSNKEMLSFLSFLKKLKEKGDDLNLNLKEFEFDLKQGMYFDSNIPAGYGLGSSGALSAAIFEKYFQASVEDLSLLELKDNLALMEGHFHGSSSGFDPLLSLLNVPLLYKEDKSLEKINLELPRFGDGSVFIIDTGKSRRTEPLVNLYKEKLKNSDFEVLCQTQLNDITNQCINLLLENNFNGLVSKFKELSEFQYEHFLPMIPPIFKDDWVQGLESNKYYLKLCGAGGGGYLLGITSNFEDFKFFNPDKEVKVVFRF